MIFSYFWSTLLLLVLLVNVISAERVALKISFKVLNWNLSLFGNLYSTGDLEVDQWYSNRIWSRWRQHFARSRNCKCSKWRPAWLTAKSIARRDGKSFRCAPTIRTCCFREWIPSGKMPAGRPQSARNFYAFGTNIWMEVRREISFFSFLQLFYALFFLLTKSKVCPNWMHQSFYDFMFINFWSGT